MIKRDIAKSDNESNMGRKQSKNHFFKVKRHAHAVNARLILLVIFIAFFLLGISIISAANSIAYKLTHPKRHAITVFPSNFSMPVYHNISFHSTDGIALSGWIIPPANRMNKNASATVIIAHGLAGSRMYCLKYAKFVHDAGFTVLAFDFRGHGQSGGDATSIGLKESLDILGAIEYIKTNATLNPKRIALYGFSMGGAASIIAAAESDDAHAVISDSAFASLRPFTNKIITKNMYPSSIMNPLTVYFMGRYGGIDIDDDAPKDYIASISPRPVLLIQDDGDKTVDPNDINILYDNAGQPKEKFIVHGAGHGGSYSVEPELYKLRVLTFLNNALAD